MNTSANTSPDKVDLKLQQKLREFSAAEQQGKSKEILSGIYKEIKDLQCQLAFRRIGKK